MGENHKRLASALVLIAMVAGAAMAVWVPKSEAKPPIVVRTPSLQMPMEQVGFEPIPVSVDIQSNEQEEH